MKQNSMSRGRNPDQKISQTLTDGAYWKIKQMIFQQKVVPGQRMVYKDMSDMLKMSPTPIINAFIRLEQEGFMVSEAHRGFYIKPFDLQEVSDRSEVREALELKVIEHAVQLCGSNDIDILEEKREKHMQYMPMHYNRQKLILDAEFHIQIAIIARNKILEKILRTNFEHLYLRLSLEHWGTKRMVVAVQEHADLMERIKAKDQRGALKVMQHHLRGARDNIIASLHVEIGSIHL